jgi:hypothetical protein
MKMHVGPLHLMAASMAYRHKTMVSGTFIHHLQVIPLSILFDCVVFNICIVYLLFIRSL